jgi:LytS/YehU family sensor histidine kinase
MRRAFPTHHRSTLKKPTTMNLTRTRSLLVAVCLGLFDLMATTTQAGETTEPPTKQLRGSFDQQERLLVPLEEELAVVRAYLDIESLRLGDRLRVEQTIDPGLSKVLMPPFSFQPLVENAVQHGLYSSARAGRLQLVVRPKGEWLEMSVSDDGQGVPAAEIEHLFFAERPRVHALVLLRRRLQGLFGQSFQLEARSEIGEGTTVTMRIPLRKRFEVGLLSPRAITSDLRELAPN